MRPGPLSRFSLVWVWILAESSTLGILIVLLRQGAGFVPVALLALSAALWAFLSVRAYVLFRRVQGFMKHLLDNDFETGIKTDGLLRDEIASISRLGERVASQLRMYDMICKDLIRVLNKQIEVLLKDSETAVMVADLNGMSFRANPAMQKLFGVEQDVFSFESVRKQDGNARFYSAFIRSAVRDAVPGEGRASLQLPVRESRMEVSFRIVPVKDSREKPLVALVFISPL